MNKAGWPIRCAACPAADGDWCLGLDHPEYCAHAAAELAGTAPPGYRDVIRRRSKGRAEPPAPAFIPWQPGDGFEALRSAPPRPTEGRGAVTVLIPTATRPHTIGRALASVAAQTRSDWRCVVCLNGDYDRAAYRAALAPFRGCLHAVTGSPVAGIPEALNAGLPLVATEYVAVLDDDDEWHPEFLATLTAAMDADPCASFVYCDIREERGGVEVVQTIPPEVPSYAEMWRRPWIAFPMGVFRRAYLGPDGFDPRAGGCCDWDVWHRGLAASGGRMVHVPRQLMTHHWHGSNTSDGDPRMRGWHDYIRSKQRGGAYGPDPTRPAWAEPPRMADCGSGVWVGNYAACDAKGGEFPRRVHLWHDYHAPRWLCAARGGDLTVRYRDGAPLATASATLDQIAAFASCPGPLLVHCARGGCRGPTFAVVALVARGVPFAEAAAKVRAATATYGVPAPDLRPAVLAEIEAWASARRASKPRLGVGQTIERAGPGRR